jgi:hypothetical protein
VVEAEVFVGVSPARFDVPPTEFYMNAVKEGAYENGLTMMWLDHLASFETQPGKPPSVAPAGR